MPTTMERFGLNIKCLPVRVPLHFSSHSPGQPLPSPLMSSLPILSLSAYKTKSKTYTKSYKIEEAR